jgi:hypothetical protein
MTTFSIPKSSKICPHWDFWSEKKPSGNPETNAKSANFWGNLEETQSGNRNVEKESFFVCLLRQNQHKPIC